MNENFVPVWINVRTEPLPNLPFWSEVLINAHLDTRNRIIDPFSDGFFLRTVVTSSSMGSAC